jgi:glyoxylase-like metal-dependent hydrolase (beta-lactamase superfamily II)
MHVNRRTLLTGAAAVSAASALSPISFANAKAPLAGKQNPGWYRYKVGEIEVTVVTDGAGTTPLSDIYVKNAPKAEVSAALVQMYGAPDKVTHPYTPVVINTGSKLVVIDTGVGLGAYQQSKGAIGQFHSNLAAAGIDPATVDTVIISHLHGDHINGLLGADNKLAFPNAEVLIPAVDVKYWSDKSQASKVPPPVAGQFANVERVLGALGGKVTQYEGSKELVPGITAMPTPGHTPGHTSFVVASGSSSVLLQIDVTGGAAAMFTGHPEWHFLFDVDGPLAEQTRRKIYDMAATDKLLVQGYHFPFPSVGHIEKVGNGYRWVPAPWNPLI